VVPVRVRRSVRTVSYGTLKTTWLYAITPGNVQVLGSDW
jgi:hypothetical protein